MKILKGKNNVKKISHEEKTETSKVNGERKDNTFYAPGAKRCTEEGIEIKSKYSK